VIFHTSRLSLFHDRRCPGNADTAFLTRIDPTRNINRFYLVDVMPTLFGASSLLIGQLPGLFADSVRP